MFALTTAGLVLLALLAGGWMAHRSRLKKLHWTELEEADMGLTEEAEAEAERSMLTKIPNR